LIEDEDLDNINFLICDDEVFRLVAYAIGPSLFSTETWWYMLLMGVKEHEIMRYEKEEETRLIFMGRLC
jgi:hypothetical protein